MGRISSLLLLTLAGAAPAWAGLRNNGNGIHIGHKGVAPLFANPDDGGDLDQPGVLSPHAGKDFFDQYIDHANPSLGTFKQKYYWSVEFYRGSGSPVVFFTPGEDYASWYTQYITNQRLPGMVAQELGAAIVMVEHRYYGDSSPFVNLTTENLQYLTLDNAMADFINFARTVKLPFDVVGNGTANCTANAPGTPWVAVGFSYGGALWAWIEALAPGTIWAYHASSATVEAVKDNWRYFSGFQEGAPKNCTSDMAVVIDHVDGILQNGTADKKQALKDSFGLGPIQHDDDFAYTLTYGVSSWQQTQPTSNYTWGPFQFCDYIENVPNATYGSPVPGPEGVGLDKALEGLQDWIRDFVLPGDCHSKDNYYQVGDKWGCLDSYNATSLVYTDTSVMNSANRQWMWMLCNEPFEFWKTAAPEGQPTVVSRLINPDSYVRLCGLYFPPSPRPDGGQYTYGLASGKTPDQINERTGGWDGNNSTRLIYVNGEFDPWRGVSVSSEGRPGGPLASTEDAPVLMIKGGNHASDTRASYGAANSAVHEVQQQVIATLKKWVSEFPADGKWTAQKKWLADGKW